MTLRRNLYTAHIESALREVRVAVVHLPEDAPQRLRDLHARALLLLAEIAEHHENCVPRRGDLTDDTTDSTVSTSSHDEGAIPSHD